MALPLPTTSRFPAAQSGLFPVSEAAQAPMFGVNPYTPGQNMFTGATQYVDPSLGIPDLAARRAAQTQQIQMAQLASMGLAPATDPHTWTPQEAADQTDQAIAKIATVNPDMAQMLMDQRAPDPESDGNSFWDSLKHVAGEVLSPALNIGGKVLDIVGRTAYIVPNVAFDLADGGETDVWGDVGGALTGNTKHNWNSVFQEMGWEGDGIGGFLRATVGFAGDIATDPLTWIIPAGAGVKSAEAAGRTAEVAATRTASLVEEGAKVFGDEAGARMLTNYDALTKRMVDEGVQMGADDTAERVAALIGEMPHEAERQLLAKQFEVADKVYRAQRTRSLSTLLRGGGIYDESGQLLASTKDVKGALEGAVQQSLGAAHGSTEWQQARAIASSLGGTRFKAAVPFLPLRYISPAIPGSKFLSEKSFGVFSRLMAGQSGMNRMASYIAAHPEEGWAPMKTWMEQGFDKALEQHPQAINQLRGKFKNLGSMFYSASEQVGRITAHFDSMAGATRAGLGGYIAANTAVAIRAKREQLIREVAYQVQDRSGNQVNREQFLRQLESQLHVSYRKKYDTASAADLEKMADYLDTFPPDLDTADPAAIAAWWNSQPQNAIGPQTAEEAALREDDLRYAQAVAAGFSPAQRQTLDQVAAVWDHVRNEVAKRDGSLGDVRMDFGQAGKLTPGQAEQAVTGTQLPETVYFTPGDAGSAARVRQVGITGDEVGAVDDFVGVHFDVAAGGEAGVASGAVPARVKLTNPLYIDESEQGALLDEVVTEADNEAANITHQTNDAVDAAMEWPSGTNEATGTAMKSRAEMVTEKVRKEHPENDGVIIKRADGSLHVVVFDHRNAWTVDDGAANLVAQRGFFHRTLTPQAKEWLRGKTPTEGQRLLIAEPELEAFLKRQTIHMNRREAERFMHDYLGRLYGAEGMPDQIWESHLLKVHEHYIDKQAEAVVSEMVGDSSRRFMLLNDVAPAMFGSAPRDQKYAWAMSPTLLTALKKKDTALTKAIMQSHAADYRRMEEQHAQLARDAEQYGLLQAVVEESLGYGVPVPDRLIAAARKYGSTVSDAQSKVDKNLAGLDKTEGHLVTQLTAYDDAFAAVPAENAAAHPKSADLIVTPNEDGTHTLKGWHYNQVGAGPEAVYAVPPDELGSSGFHMGTWDQASYLARLDADSAGRTIGSRDGHDWPMDIDVYPEGADPAVADSVWSTDAQSSRLKPGESVEDYARRASGEKNGVVVVTPKEPDIFFEDVINPVEARGKFVGAEGAPLSEGPTEAGDEFLGSTFTGSGAGAGRSPLGAAERGRIAGMGTGNNDGAIYRNAVEGDARSAVILNPSPDVVWTARGPQSFEDAVREGKVFVTKEGKVTMQRVAGSRRLKPREDILQQLSNVRAEKEQLRELQTRLRKGGEALESKPIPGDVTEAAASLGSAVAARAKRESQAQYAAGKRLARLRERTHAAMGEANKAYAEFHGALAKTKPSLVKVETAGDLGGLTRLHVPGLEGFAMPAYIAEEFHSLVDKHGIGHLRESWRKYVMGPWKRWATYRWPGFHVRNFFGAFFNNWLGGVVERDYVFSWRVNHARDGQLKWANRTVSDWELANYGLKRVFKERPTYAQVADLLSSQGIGRANTMAVMGIGSASVAVHDGLDAIGKDGNIVKRSAQKADGLMKSMGSSVEDFHRVAAWGRGMAATNGDTYGARAFVMMRHGDYSDLTGAEDFIRDLVPFYKWQRTNIPYQLRMLAENPAKLTLVHDKIPGYAYDVEGIDRQQAELQQPDWMKETTAIPIPSWVPVVGSKDKDALKFAMFDLPYSDLYNGLNDYMSSGLPVVRNVLESYGFKQTLFSGKELNGKYVPLSGVFNLPGVRDILHAANLTQRGADGQEYMEDKLQNVLMGWPIFSRFRNFTESDPERVDARVGGLFSMMAGVGIREGDYTSAELDFYYNEVQPLLDQYKSLGIQMPTMDDIQSGEVGAATGLFGTTTPFAA